MFCFSDCTSFHHLFWPRSLYWKVIFAAGNDLFLLSWWIRCCQRLVKLPDGWGHSPNPTFNSLLFIMNYFPNTCFFVIDVLWVVDGTILLVVAQIVFKTSGGWFDQYCFNNLSFCVINSGIFGIILSNILEQLRNAIQ